MTATEEQDFTVAINKLIEELVREELTHRFAKPPEALVHSLGHQANEA